MANINIINNTPHAINVIDPDDCRFDTTIRKWVADPNVTPVVTIPSSGPLNADIITVDVDPVDKIPMFAKAIRGCDPLPNDGAIHIVSALFASAFIKGGGNPNRILLEADPVMSPDGKTFLGYRGLTKPF
jgi:hypothetical protein